MNTLTAIAIDNLHSFLDFRDLLGLTFTCKRFYSLGIRDRHWRKFNRKYWLVNRYEENNFFDTFKHFYSDFGRYLDCYASVKSAWNSISTFCSASAPRINDALLPGSCEGDLSDLERRIGFAVPNDLRCSLRICAGQRMCPGSGHAGLFGGRNPDGSDEGFLRTFRGSYHQQANELNLIFDCCISLNKYQHSTYDDVPLCYCVKDSTKFALKRGMVFFISTSTRNTQGLHNIVLVAYSFADFLKKTLANLSKMTPLHGSLSRFEFNISERTGPFLVSVGTTFDEVRTLMPAIDAPTFLYRITITMDTNALQNESCQLMKRHWDIIDADDNAEVVEGDGVVGEFPIFTPGAGYSWISGTHFVSSTGSMKGFFTMRRLHDDSELTIICPLFKMTTPEILSIKERRELYDMSLSYYA